jgi:hypothetical protein
MTFKHTKFEDSPVMRSLEKLALKKGLIKNNPLEKIASKSSKLDLTPTDNLMSNLLKLCNGLKESGFEKYAEELENTFVMYKHASCECDHDLVDQAHPKGSHKLEGVLGDAIIETILDQHLAMMKVVEKKPVGKLSTAKDIINAVKISLADNEFRDIDCLQNKGKELLTQAIDKIVEGLKNIKDAPSGEAVPFTILFNTPYENKVERSIYILSSAKNFISNNFVTKKYIEELFGTIHLVRIIRDQTYNQVIQNNIYAQGSNERKTFLQNIALIDKGVTLSWAANKAFNGDMSGASFHESAISATEIMNSIRNLINGLGENIVRYNTINYEQKKDKLDDTIRNMADEFKTKLNNSINAAELAAKNLQSQTFNKGLGVINFNEIGNLFSSPLEYLKVNYQSLDQFNSRINTLIVAYKRSMDGLEKKLNEIK